MAKVNIAQNQERTPRTQLPHPPRRPQPRSPATGSEYDTAGDSTADLLATANTRASRSLQTPQTQDLNEAYPVRCNSKSPQTPATTGVFLLSRSELRASGKAPSRGARGNNRWHAAPGPHRPIRNAGRTTNPPMGRRVWAEQRGTAPATSALAAGAVSGDLASLKRWLHVEFRQGCFVRSNEGLGEGSPAAVPLGRSKVAGGWNQELVPRGLSRRAAVSVRAVSPTGWVFEGGVGCSSSMVTKAKRRLTARSILAMLRSAVFIVART